MSENIGLFYQDQKKEVVLVIDDVSTAQHPHPRIPGPGLGGQADLQAAGRHRHEGVQPQLRGLQPRGRVQGHRGRGVR